MRLLDVLQANGLIALKPTIVRTMTFVVLLAICSPLLSQLPTDMNLDTGIRANEAYDQGSESISIESGNLNLQIPLVHLPGRNGHDLDLSLTYNSQVWSPVASLVTPNNVDSIYIGWTPSSSGLGETGWQISLPTLYATGTVTFSNGSAGPPPYGTSYGATECWTNFVVVMGDGSKYSFPNASLLCQQQQTTCGGSESNCITTDYQQWQYSDHLLAFDSGSEGGVGQGTSTLLDLSHFAQNLAIVHFKDGSQIQFALAKQWGARPTGTMAALASGLVDTNGNVTSISESLSGLTMTDTNGRSVTWSEGCPGTVQYQDSTGAARTITLNCTNFPVSIPLPTFTTPAAGSNNITSVESGQITGPMLSSVVLPNGLSYTFQYNEYGEILEETYPTGGYTRYVYQALPSSREYEWTTGTSGSADSRGVIEKDTCPVAVVAAGTTAPSGYVGSSVSSTCPVAENRTTYARTVSPLTVTDPLGNQTLYTFGECAGAAFPTNPPPGLINYGYGGEPLEATKVVYQGTSKLLQTVNTNYQGCLPVNKTVILPNGWQSETTWTYDSSNYPYTVVLTDNNTQFTYNMNAETDNLLNQNEYAFGQGAPGAIFRKTVNTYLATNPVNSLNYQNYNLYILNRELSSTISNGTGSQIAQTTYEYDNYRGGIVPSGAVQHGTLLNDYNSTYTTRGNVTAVNKWLNTTGTTLSTLNNEFDDTGNILTQQDPKGNSTTFSYGDAWGSSACKPSNGFTAAYVTNIKNALSQNTQYTWNSCTGTTASVTDPNQQPTYFGYDLMDRRVYANYPDLGQTCLQYSDAPNSYCPASTSPALPIEITSTKKVILGTVSEVSNTILDGLARTVQTQLTSDPGGPDYVVTNYDPVGNVGSISNAYRSSGDPTFGSTSYQYDALHRKLAQTQPDGFARQWCYDGVQLNQSPGLCSTNLGSPSLIGSWTDYADELGNHTQWTSDAPGRLIKTIEAIGAETDYSYDALDDLSAVTQMGLTSETARIRNFYYDSLARMTASNNQETGTINYVYDANGNVYTKTDARNIQTTYSYDPLNRLLSKSYSNNDPASTPWSCYQYDSTSTKNGMGRLANAWTQSASMGTCSATAPNSGFITERSISAYDPMGRILNEQEYTPASQASGTSYSPAFTYNLLGDVLTSTDGSTPSPTTPGATIQFTNAYDGAAHLVSVTSNWVDLTHPSPLLSLPMGQTNNPCANSSAGSYTPFGALQNASYGNGVTFNRSYDVRLRPTCEIDTQSNPAPTSGAAVVTVTGSEQIN